MLALETATNSEIINLSHRRILGYEGLFNISKSFFLMFFLCKAGCFKRETVESVCVCLVTEEVGSLERLLSLAPVCLCACSHTHTNKQAQLDFGRDTICPVLPNPVRGK